VTESTARPPSDDAAGWLETAIVTTVAGALMYALVRAAFTTWFFAENFVYLGQYHAAGEDFWRAAFSPTLWIFFRPVLFAASLPWHFVLPLDPTPYHWRNFAFAALNLMLLHRVLLRLTPSRPARVVAVLLVAVSKIHLTTIGYLNMFDAVVLLALVLLTVLFLLRYLDTRRPYDYALMLAGMVLTVFSKDHGFAVVPVLVATIARGGNRQGARGPGVLVVAHDANCGDRRALRRDPSGDRRASVRRTHAHVRSGVLTRPRAPEAAVVRGDHRQPRVLA
jgi:hypothetical protein